MTPRQAAEVVLWAGAAEKRDGVVRGSVIVRQMPTCYLGAIANAIAGSEHPAKLIGARPGEKMEESLFNKDELPRLLIHKTELGLFGVVLPHTDYFLGTGAEEHFSQHRQQLSTEEVRAMLVEAGVLP